MHPHTKFEIPTSNNIRDMLRTRLFSKLGQRSRSQGPKKWYATLRHPKMYPNTKFDGRTDRRTDGRTVLLLFASQSSFGGIKMSHYAIASAVIHVDPLAERYLFHTLIN